MGANHVLFKDRFHSGVLLAETLVRFRGKPAIILGLARGGVVTASGVSSVLNIPYDVLVIHKISSPYNKEFALGAVAPDGTSVVHWPDAHRVGADEGYIKEAIRLQVSAISKQALMYRKGKPPIQIDGKTVLLIDDGAATGATMEAAVRWAKKKKAKEIVVALPVLPKEVAALLRPEVDALVYCHCAETFESVGGFYETFPQISDEEVITLVRDRDKG